MKIAQIQLEHEIFANCYLLEDEKTGEAAIVDPAWYVDEFNDIYTYKMDETKKLFFRYLSF